MNGMIRNQLDEDELIVRATAAYLRRCRRYGRLEGQPSAGMSEYRDGILAAYAVAAEAG